MLVKGGKLNSTYQITVPEDLVAFSDVYRKQVELLIRILPFIEGEDCFALKGGTAQDATIPAVDVHFDAFRVGAEAGVLVDESPMAMTVV
jgi:hypothetical protein